MTDTPLDPIRRAAELITTAAGLTNDHPQTTELEHRLKQDIVNSIGRIKPSLVASLDFTKDVIEGDFFSDLPAPLQGIAIARCEGALAFYNRIGWHDSFLQAPLTTCVPEDGIEPLEQRYHAKTLHDLSYVHPKHFDKMLGKAGSASLWETLKRHVTTLNQS